MDHDDTPRPSDGSPDDGSPSDPSDGPAHSLEPDGIAHTRQRVILWLGVLFAITWLVMFVLTSAGVISVSYEALALLGAIAAGLLQIEVLPGIIGDLRGR